MPLKHSLIEKPVLEKPIPENHPEDENDALAKTEFMRTEIISSIEEAKLKKTRKAEIIKMRKDLADMPTDQIPANLQKSPTDGGISLEEVEENFPDISSSPKKTGKSQDAINKKILNEISNKLSYLTNKQASPKKIDKIINQDSLIDKLLRRKTPFNKKAGKILNYFKIDKINDTINRRQIYNIILSNLQILKGEEIVNIYRNTGNFGTLDILKQEYPEKAQKIQQEINDINDKYETQKQEFVNKLDLKITDEQKQELLELKPKKEDDEEFTKLLIKQREGKKFTEYEQDRFNTLEEKIKKQGELFTLDERKKYFELSNKLEIEKK